MLIIDPSSPGSGFQGVIDQTGFRGYRHSTLPGRRRYNLIEDFPPPHHRSPVRKLS